MGDQPRVYVEKLTAFEPDGKNANLGTERGRYMIDKSLEEVGAGRSIVVDRHNRVPAGNKTLEAAVESGFEDAIVVETDGKRLVVVKRTDWDLEDADPNNPARRYAYWDNRTGQVDLSLDSEQIAADLVAGLDLSAMFYAWELENLGVGEGGELIDPDTEWQGMPEFEQDDAFGAIATIKVHFKTEEDIERFAELVEQTVTKDSTFIWYPKQQKENLKAYVVHDES